MPDRFAMRTDNVERLLDELGIPLPARVAQSRASIARLGELVVVLKPQLSREQLAQRALAMLDRGEQLDLVALVQDNESAAFHVEALATERAMQDHAELVHEAAIRGVVRELLRLTRAENEKLLADVRKLPAGTPTNAQAAVDAGPEAVKSFQVLRAHGDRFTKLRALHAELLAGDCDPTAFSWFRDSKVLPTWGMVRPEPAGPTELLARLRWLSTPSAQAWTPSGPECTEHYLEVSRARQAPKTAAAVKM